MLLVFQLGLFWHRRSQEFVLGAWQPRRRDWDAKGVEGEGQGRPKAPRRRKMRHRNPSGTKIRKLGRTKFIFLF